MINHHHSILMNRPVVASRHIAGMPAPGERVRSGSAMELGLSGEQANNLFPGSGSYLKSNSKQSWAPAERSFGPDPDPTSSNLNALLGTKAATTDRPKAYTTLSRPSSTLGARRFVCAGKAISLNDRKQPIRFTDALNQWLLRG